MTVVDLPFPFHEGFAIPFDVDSVNTYRKCQWANLIPLPFGKQTPPPPKFSGRQAKFADSAQLKEWIKESRRGAKAAIGGRKTAGPYNIAVVHGIDTIAIDVDDYEYTDKKSGEIKRKFGGKSLEKLEKQLGKLPATWISSARGEPGRNPSGQRFFRLKPEHYTNILRYNDKPADAIEIVRAGHRYSVVWPSMNGRLGEQYVWWHKVNRSGTWIWVQSSVPPKASELPLLPDKWVEFLTSGLTAYQETKKLDPGVLGASDMKKWIDQRACNNAVTDDGDDAERYEPPPCRAMRVCINTGIEELSDESGGRHDSMVRRIWNGMQLAAEGHSGIKVFLSTLKEKFVEEIQGSRDGGEREANDEWRRALIGGFEGAVVKKKVLLQNSCNCPKPSDEFGDLELDPASVMQNDDGNAEMLVEMMRSNMRWIAEEDRWVFWDPAFGTWRSDDDTRITVLARSVSERIRERAGEMFEYIRSNDPDERSALEKQAKKLYAWGVLVGNRGKIANMIELAKSRDNITISGREMNARRDLLVCKNGTLLLPPRGGIDGKPNANVEFRPSTREDLNTISTGVDYIPWKEIRKGGEGAALLRGRQHVEDYLDTFIPDGDLRWYFQRVFGYSLYGANPERKIVFLQGSTSTGKSTILASISGALGAYSGPFNLSLLRDKQDEGPRAELVNAFNRRIITASESSVEWRLHADMIKRVTGGSDTLAARLLYSNEIVEQVPAFMPLIATNTSPTIESADSATWRRLLVLPFDIQVGLEGGVEALQKAGLDSFMAADPACRMAWLSWLVDGYIGYVREGIDNSPKAVVARTQEFRSGVSDFHTFLNDHIVSDETTLGKHLTLSQVYAAYEAWCFDQRIRQSNRLSKVVFKRKLQDNGFDVEKRFPRVGDDEWDPKRKVRYVYIHHSAFATNSNADDEVNGVETKPGKYPMHNFETQFKDGEKQEDKEPDGKKE